MAGFFRHDAHPDRALAEALALAADLFARVAAATADPPGVTRASYGEGGAIARRMLAGAARGEVGSRALFGLLPKQAPDTVRRVDTGRSPAGHMAEQGLGPTPIREGRALLDPAARRFAPGPICLSPPPAASPFPRDPRDAPLPGVPRDTSRTR